MSVRVCVVGAGVIGLSTAIHVQERIPGARVTVVADKFSPDTTSDVAAGFWTPFAIKDTSIELQRKWGKATLDHLLELSKTPEGGSIGVYPVSGYWINETKLERHFWADLVYGYREASQEELRSMFPAKYKYGFYYQAMVSDPSRYTQWLMNRIKENGGTFACRNLSKLHELYDSYDVIVNCSGLGARELCDDKRMVPIRGQVTQVYAPWVKQFVVAYGDSAYVFPRVDRIVMGGCFQEGNSSLEVSPSDGQNIFNKCCSLVPGLKEAQVVSHHVALRPARDSVRLELELVRHGNRTIPIVHNYGHGGSGWTLQWGCAADAADLVERGIKQSGLVKTSKL